jgi:polar amino acid transport system substrate-binding protein
MDPTIRGVAVAALVLCLAACDRDTPPPDEDATDGFELATPGQLTVCSDVPNEPFQYEDPAAPSGYSGFDIDLLQAVAEDLELDLEVRPTSFDDIVSASAMAAGDCDLGASAITITEAWQDTLDFTEPYYAPLQSLLVAAVSGIDSLEDTAGARLGVQTGSIGQAYAAEHAPPDAEIVEFGTASDLFVAVDAGAVDAVLQDLPVNAEHARAETDIDVVETFDTGDGYGFAVEAGRDDGLLEAIQGSLDRLVDDGTHETLYERYFGTG